MGIFDRFKAPTPIFFKKIIKVSLASSAGATALLLANPIGSAIIPDFNFTLLPMVSLICKNIVVGGIVAAAVAKATHEMPEEKEKQP